MLLNKAGKSLYEKDKTFYKYYLDLEDKNVLYESQKLKAKIFFVLPLSNRKKDINRLSTLNNIKGPFKLLHVDVADIQFFFFKSGVDPKYCLLVVDLFTSKTYIYPMRSRNLLARKLQLFYQDIHPKRQQRLQTDLEFQQNEIKKLNQKYNVEMFSGRGRGGKAYAVE